MSVALSGGVSSSPGSELPFTWPASATVGREVDDAILRQLAGFAQALDFGLSSTRAKPDVITVDRQVARHGAQLVRRFG